MKKYYSLIIVIIGMLIAGSFVLFGSDLFNTGEPESDTSREKQEVVVEKKEADLNIEVEDSYIDDFELEEIDQQFTEDYKQVEMELDTIDIDENEEGETLTEDLTLIINE